MSARGLERPEGSENVWLSERIAGPRFLGCECVPCVFVRACSEGDPLGAESVQPRLGGAGAGCLAVSAVIKSQVKSSQATVTRTGQGTISRKE